MAEVATESPAKVLLRQFYAWEERGRGWHLANQAIRPEPPFVPFQGHYIPDTPLPDDGRHPTFLSSLVEGIGGLLSGRSNRVEPEEPEAPEETKAVEDTRTRLVALQVHLPADAEPTMEVFEQFLVSSGRCRHPLCFELVGTDNSVVLQFVVDVTDADHLQAQLTGHFPEAVLTRTAQDRDTTWDGSRRFTHTLIVEFGLSREFMLPLQTHGELSVDPWVGLVSALSSVSSDDIAGIQVLFEPVSHPWARSILRAVTAPDGSSFFDNAPDFLTEAKKKVSRPLFAVVLRIACASDDEDHTWAAAKAIAGTLEQFANPTGNALIPLINDGYDDHDHLDDLLARRSRRVGMLLNSEELASLVHLPGPEVRSPGFSRLVKRSKAAPASTRNHALVLGTNTHHGMSVDVSLSADQRVRHMHVIGASGTGKSTFLLNMILQDIEQGQGVGVLDPHGDLIDHILSRIPASRIKDVILVDPSDEEYPIGFNILSAHSDLEKTLLSSDLVAVFRRFSTSWGDQMSSVLGNAVLAFLESNRGGTLSDLRRFLIEPAFRTEFLATVQDPHVVYFWKKEFSLLTGRPQAPLLTRLDTFLRPKPIRYMVSQQVNKLNFAEIMDGKKIFLAKLSQGAIGEENASLLGSLIVSKFHQLTLGRQSMAEAHRNYFWLYCDEFGGYVTPSMAKLLCGARKYRLGLILAHQEMHQLRDEDVKSAVIANAGTRVCFRVGDTDAKTLAEGFTAFEPEDLRNLATGEALCKVGRVEDDFNLHVPMTQEVDADAAEKSRLAIVAHTRSMYGTPREEVESQLLRAHAEEIEAPAKPTRMPPLAHPQVEPERVKEEKTSSETQRTEVVPTPPPVVRKPRTSPPVVAPLGKGGQQHKYLQHMISQWAQGMGWRTTIEMPTPDGSGSVDVVLEKDGRRIACEISVTSTVEQELGNLRKCLAAGFTEIFMVGVEKKALAGLQKASETATDQKSLEKVHFMDHEEFLATPSLLDGDSSGGDQTVCGYKIKLNLHSLNTKDISNRRRTISEVLGKALRKNS